MGSGVVMSSAHARSSRPGESAPGRDALQQQRRSRLPSCAPCVVTDHGRNVLSSQRSHWREGGGRITRTPRGVGRTYRGGGGREERRCPVFSSFSCSRLWPVCSRLYPPLWPVCSRCRFRPPILLYVVDFIGEVGGTRPCRAALFPLPPAVRRQIRPVSVLGAPSQNGQMPRADSPAAAFPGGQQHTPTGRSACPDPAHTTRPALPPLSCPDGRSPARGRAGGVHRGQQVGPSAHDSQASTRRKGGPIRRPGTGSPRHLAAACPGSRPTPASSAGAVPRTRFGCTRAPAHRARHGPVVPL